MSIVKSDRGKEGKEGEGIIKGKRKDRKRKPSKTLNAISEALNNMSR